MTMRTARPRLATATVLSAALGATLALGSSPASAAVSDGYVSGAGSFRNDWSDERVHAGYHSPSNAACLWQKILWAEGLLGESDVDGVYGGKTTDRTKTLQSAWRIPRTGKADNRTFNTAASHLRYVSGSTASGKRLELKYDGNSHDFTVRRDERGRHGFYADGSWKAAAYKQRTCR